MDELEKTILSLKKNSFDINIYGKVINFKINENTKKWVTHYKSNLINQVKKIHEDSFKSVDFETFFVIYYIFKFVLPDIFMIGKLLPNENEIVLELGSGLGFFAVILYYLLHKNIQLHLVEIENTSNFNSEFNYKMDQNNTNALNNDHILPLKLLKEFLDLNKVKAKIYSPEELKESNLKNINFVYSFRSYCFLYEIEEYSKFLSHGMSNDGKIICDASKQKKQNIKFKEEFFYKKTIAESDAFERIYAMKNFTIGYN